jgi:hypothetical protein
MSQAFGLILYSVAEATVSVSVLNLALAEVLAGRYDLIAR